MAAAGTHDEAAVETHVAMLVSEGHLRRVLEYFRAERSVLLTDLTEPESQFDVDVDALELENLKQNLRAFPDRRSRVIGITFTSTSPAVSAAVANRTADLHVAAIAERRAADRQETLNSLAERLPLAKAEVERTEAALQAYRVTHGFTEVNQPDEADQQLTDVNRQLALAYSDLASRQGRMKALHELQPSRDPLPILIDALNNSSLRSLYRAHQAGLRSGSMAAMSSPAQPTLQVASANPHDIRVVISESIAQSVSQLASETSTIEGRVRSLQQRLTTLQNASTHLRKSEKFKYANSNVKPPPLSKSTIAFCSGRRRCCLSEKVCRMCACCSLQKSRSYRVRRIQLYSFCQPCWRPFSAPVSWRWCSTAWTTVCAAIEMWRIGLKSHALGSFRNLVRVTGSIRAGIFFKIPCRPTRRRSGLQLPSLSNCQVSATLQRCFL